MLIPLAACKKNKIKTLHTEIMNLLQNLLPIAEQAREIRNLKNQLISLENNAIIPHSTPYYPTAYSHLLQTTGPIYSSEVFGSTTSFFIPDEWEKKLKPLPLCSSKKTRQISSQNPQSLPSENPQALPPPNLENSYKS